jgi:phage FluMu gp28-like protein
MTWTSRKLKETLLDPVRFIHEFCYVPYPGKGGIKINLDPYARKFLWDTNPLRFILKSRRVGFSTLFSLEAFHQSILNDETMSFFVSKKEDQACEMLRVARYAARNLPEPLYVDITKDRETKLEFGNGSRIMALSSSTDAARGFTGNVYLDEWAFVPNAHDVWIAASKVIAVGELKLTMSSTARGQSGHYYETYETIQDAIRLGEESKWSFSKVPWNDCPRLTYEVIRDLCETEEEFQMEFNCVFVDETMTLFPYKLIDDPAVCWDHLEQYTLHAPPPLREDRGRFIGIDFGRKDSETAIVMTERAGKKKVSITRIEDDKEITEEVEENIWFVRYIETMNDVPAPEQEKHIYRVYRTFRPNRVYCDQTSFGLPFVDHLQQGHLIGPSVLDGVTFTSDVKERLIYNLKGMLEAGILIIPNNKRLKSQLHAIRAEEAPGGRRKFSGKATGNDDLVWALALAVRDRVPRASIGVASVPWKDAKRKPRSEKEMDALLDRIKSDPAAYSKDEKFYIRRL